MKSEIIHSKLSELENLQKTIDEQASEMGVTQEVLIQFMKANGLKSMKVGDMEITLEG